MMKMPTICSILFTIGVLYAPWTVADVVKWVDENGKVHYGDTVPDKYKENAEIIETDNISIVGQEGDIKDSNRQYSQQLKQQDAERERQKAVQQQEVRKKSGRPAGSALTREDCRDAYPNNVKNRTRCFLQVEENEKKQQ